MEKPASEAEDPVRDELGEEERLGRSEHAPAEEVRPALRLHTQAAAQLVLARVRGLFKRERARLVDGTAAPLGERVRKAEVVAHPRIARAVLLAAHCVDGPVSRGDPRELRLGLPHPELVAPVDALAVGPVRALELELPADVAHLRVGEAAHKLRSAPGPRGSWRQ